MEIVAVFMIPFVIVSMLVFVVWSGGRSEVRGTLALVLIGVVVGGSVPTTESLARQVCRQTRPLTMDEHARIAAGTRFLCAVQQAYPAELPESVCALLSSENIQFVTNTYLPPSALRRSCSLGATTPKPRPSPTEDGPIRACHIAVRRDHLMSLAHTFLILAHEGTHATTTPLPYHFAVDRYRDERCHDENAVRDTVVVWGSHAVQFLHALPDVPPAWVADADGIAIRSGDAPSDWPQRREALITEIERTIRQAPDDADNAHQTCAGEQQTTAAEQP